jgi:hypothetical protein
MVAKETRIVVVVDEETEGGDVGEVTLLSIVAVLDVTHVLARAKHILDGVVHGVVEESGDVTLVGSDVSRVAVEVLSHLEDARGISELLPEVLSNFGNGVDTNTIEVVRGDEVLNPVLELATDPLVVLVEIGKIGKTAVLNLLLVVPVGDLAVIVVVFSRVVRCDLSVIGTDGGNVVSNNVYHHPDAHIVSSRDERLEVISSAEVGVDLIPVAGPVAVVSGVEVVDDGADPDGVESHAFDVVKVVLEAVESATAVVTEVSAATISGAVLSVAIGEDLIDGSLFPSGGVAGVSKSGQSGHSEGNLLPRNIHKIL